MTQWFYLNNGTVGSPWALSSVPAGTQLVEIQSAQLPNQGSLWQLTLAGYIINPDGRVLTVGSPANNAKWNLGLASMAGTPSTPVASQQWVIQAVPTQPGLGVIVNQSTGLACITDNDPYSGAGVWLQQLSAMDGDIPAGMLWQVQPGCPATGQWNQILYGDDLLTVALSTSQSQELATAVIGSAGSTSQSQASGMWMYSNDGFLTNGLNTDLVLSLGPQGSNGPTVVLYPKQSSTRATQQWAIQQGSNNTIGLVNISNNQFLTVLSDNSLTTQPFSQGSAQQAFSFAVGYPLDNILAQPQTGLPPNQTPGELTAYEYISNNMSPATPMSNGGIRAYYSDTTDIQSFYNYLTGHPDIFNAASAGVSSQDWNATYSQIENELNDCTTINALFGNFNTLLQDQVIDGSITISSVATALNASPSSASLVLSDVVEGMLYTTLSAAPGVGGVVANIMQTAYTAVLASEQGSDNTVNGDIAALQTELTNTFTNTITQLGKQYDLIVKNWGMMQAVVNLTTVQSGPNSLYWNGLETDGILTAAFMQGYQLSIAQALLPAEYTIYAWLQQISGLSNGQQWSENVIGNVVNQYSLVSGHDNASSSVLDALQSYGAFLPNVFRAAGGFGKMQTKVQSVYSFPPKNGNCNLLFTQVVNNTSSQFNVNVKTNHDDPISWEDENYSFTLLPYQSFGFTIQPQNSAESDGCDANVTMTDQSGNQISFETQQDYCMFSAGNIHLNHLSTGGYDVGWDPTSGSYGGSEWGTAVINITP